MSIFQRVITSIWTASDNSKSTSSDHPPAQSIKSTITTEFSLHSPSPNSLNISLSSSNASSYLKKTRIQHSNQSNIYQGEEKEQEEDWVFIQDDEDTDRILLHAMMIDVLDEDNNTIEPESVFTEVSESISLLHQSQALTLTTSNSIETLKNLQPPSTVTILNSKNNGVIYPNPPGKLVSSRRQRKTQKGNVKELKTQKNNNVSNDNNECIPISPTTKLHPILAQMKDQELKMKKLRKFRNGSQSLK